MRGSLRPVEDHEEWTKIVEGADSGVYAMQGFVVRDETMNRFVADQRTVEKAARRLARRKGWEEALTFVAGPMTTAQPVAGEAFDRRSPSTVAGLGDEGGWWLVVPVDYLDQVDDPRLEFHIR